MINMLFFSCCSNGKGDPSQQGFGADLLKSLLDNMPYLPAAATGGKLFNNNTEQATPLLPSFFFMTPESSFFTPPSPVFCFLSGSVFWYFVLLNYVKEEDLAGCSTACASLLTAISRQLQDRLTPLEALLQTRYLSNYSVQD